MCHNWLLSRWTYSRPQRSSWSCLRTHLPLGQPNDIRYLWFSVARFQPYVHTTGRWRTRLTIRSRYGMYLVGCSSLARRTMCLRLSPMPFPLNRQHPQQDASIHRDYLRLHPLLRHILASLPTHHLGPYPQAEVVVPCQSRHCSRHRIRLVRMVNHSSRRCWTRLWSTIRSQGECPHLADVDLHLVLLQQHVHFEYVQSTL